MVRPLTSIRKNPRRSRNKAKNHMPDSTNPPAPIGPWVRRFFSAMDKAELPWAVLRGAEGLPDDTRYDIDLLVAPGVIDRAESLLHEAAAAENWKLIRIIDKYRYRCCLMISPGPHRRYVPVDLFGECLHRHVPMADSAYGLAVAKHNAGGVKVVPPGFGAAVALIKELARHPAFKENSRDEVKAGAAEDMESFRRAADGVLGPELCGRLAEAARSGNWGQVESLAPAIRDALRKHRSLASAEGLRFLKGALLHTIRPPMSAFVVMLGPDGSGKSTIADQVAERLYKRPFKICPRFEYQFRIVPELKRIKHAIARLLGKKPPSQPAIEPGTHGSGMNRDHPMLIGMAYVTYYAFDFILGHLTIRKLRSQGGAVMFARYFYDYHYQLGYRNVPRWYLRLLERLIPKPDLVIYLERDANEIFQDKPELDVEEISRQQNVIRRLVAERSHACTVDASCGIEGTVEEVRGRVERIFLSRHGIG